VAANIRSAENLADLAVALEVRHFIQISTSAVYFSPRDQLGLTEEVPLPPPINAYAASKAEAERIVLARLGDRATVLRPRGIYGAGDTALLPRLLRAAASGPLPLLRQGRAFTDLTHVEDVVDAILAAEPRPSGAPRLYNISGGEALNIRDVVEAACGRMGIVPRWRTVPVPLAMAAAGLLEAAGRLKGSRAEPRITRYSLGILAYSQTLDLGLARRVLAWAPRIPFAEGLEEALGGLEVRALQHGAGE
jgi:nucleoside-diphosphate-sugar epimerase